MGKEYFKTSEKSDFYKFCKDNEADYYEKESNREKGIWKMPTICGAQRAAVMITFAPHAGTNKKDYNINIGYVNDNDDFTTSAVWPQEADFIISVLQKFSKLRTEE